MFCVQAVQSLQGKSPLGEGKEDNQCPGRVAEGSTSPRDAGTLPDPGPGFTHEAVGSWSCNPQQTKDQFKSWHLVCNYIPQLQRCIPQGK